jgi:hypothetical protein
MAVGGQISGCRWLSSHAGVITNLLGLSVNLLGRVSLLGADSYLLGANNIHAELSLDQESIYLRGS